MQEIILGKLREIEECENVKILHAVESGSRAWGFASPDSDYDVRFIYVRPMEYYLRLDKTRDVIEWQLDDTLDINGWDIRKALILLHKSNPTLFEWNTSPIVYKTTDVWQKLSDFIGGCFLKKSGLYHYLNTARSNYHEFLKGDTVRLKKYFYVLRPILACKWILEKGTPPPMEFHILMEEQLEERMRPIVGKLLDMKMNAPEIMTDRPIVALNEYLLGAMAEVEEAIATLPTEEGNAYDELNELFLKVLGEIW